MEQVHSQINCDLDSRIWKVRIKVGEELRVYDFNHDEFRLLFHYARSVVVGNTPPALPRVEIKKLINGGHEWNIRDAQLIAEGNNKLKQEKQRYKVSRSTLMNVSAEYSKRMIDYMTKLINSYEQSSN